MQPVSTLHRLQFALLVLVYILLLSFSLGAWFERINSDAGYYLFQIIQKKFFYQEHGRFVLWIAEILPLAGIWLKLSLKSVIILYSVNHVLLFVAGALFSWRVSGKLLPSVLITLLAFCGLRESVFTPQFELYYGLVFLVCFYTLYEKFQNIKNIPVLSGFALFTSLFFALTSHPMVVLLWLLMLVLENIQAGAFRWKWWLITAAVLIIYTLLKKMTVSSYEGGKMEWYLHHAANTDNWKIWRFIPDGWPLLVKYYPDVLLFFGAIFLQRIFNKNWLFTGIYFAGVLFFLWLVWMVYYPGRPLDRYLEQVYFPFVFAALIPVLFLKNIPGWLAAAYCFSLVFRLFSIYNAWNHFSLRTGTMDQLIQIAAKKPAQKFIIYTEDVGKDIYQEANWGYGFETLMRAVSTHHKTITITKDEDIINNGNDTALTNQGFLFTYWMRMKTDELNKDYFQFHDGKYIPLFPQKTENEMLK